MSEMMLMLKRVTAGLAGGTALASVAAGLLLLAFAAPPALAQEPPAAEQPEGAPHTRRRADLLSRLNLTPEQLQQLREIRRQSEEEARTLSRRVRLARRALDEAIYADALDESAVEARAREVAAAQSALVTLRAQTELRVRRVLTPEQLQTFRELRQQARRRQRPGRRHRHGLPPHERAEPDDPDAPAPRPGGRRP